MGGRKTPGGKFSGQRKFYKGILEKEADRTKFNPMAGTYNVGGLGTPGNKFPEGGRISPSKRTNILDGEIKRAGGIPGAVYNVQHSISKDVTGGDLQLAHLKNDGKLIERMIHVFSCRHAYLLLFHPSGAWHGTL
jgi:hypothetical protein